MQLHRIYVSVYQQRLLFSFSTLHSHRVNRHSKCLCIASIRTNQNVDEEIECKWWESRSSLDEVAWKSIFEASLEWDLNNELLKTMLKSQICTEILDEKWADKAEQSVVILNYAKEINSILLTTTINLFCLLVKEREDNIEIYNANNI